MVEEARNEPVAIVGMGCRFPGGVRSAEDLWNVVLDGDDAISEFPTTRGWPADIYDPDGRHRRGRPGTSYTRHGGFLHDADLFDAAFFGISPREALAMDPQQRLALEVSWEALEDARIDPERLRGSATAVYMGVLSWDYGGRFIQQRPDPSVEGYILLGTTISVTSGRISYTYGLTGPAVTVDTACSSALTALHLACQALRSGECPLALAGGVSVAASPWPFTEFSRQRSLAPDGRVKTFSKDADGTAWAEGAGVLVLERLADARRNGRRIHALVRGSALNQDGASDGLTAPHGPAQQDVIRQALASARLRPDQIDAVEAHGTGTPLGDRIEARALAATYGQERSGGRPLRVGSLKSNIGHTQAAAGAAGVIKMALALQRGVVPGSLHTGELSPQIDWAESGLQVLTEPAAWPETGEPRRAGVSAFGISGTNAHVVLEQADAVADPPTRSETPSAIPWVVSAKTEVALRAQAERLALHLEEHPGLDLASVGFSLASRTRFAHRGVVVAGDRTGFVEGLRTLAVHGTAAAAPKLAFLFSGQGSQRVGMGRGLYESHPVFAAALDELCAHLDPRLKDVMFEDAAGELDQTGFTQPALFALEVALFRQLEAWGVRPDVLLGHSIGEIAAAHVADVLSLEDACALVTARSRLMQALPAGGAMAALEATEPEALALIAGHEHEVSLAAVNGPSSMVISGRGDAVDTLAEQWRHEGRRATRLQVSHAFHSPDVEPLLPELGQVAGALVFRPARIPVVANLAGENLETADYWVRQARGTVRFNDGMQSLAAEDVSCFLELGPRGVLSALGQEALPDQRCFVPALRPDRPEAPTLMAAVARLHTLGVEVDWDAVFGEWAPSPVDLPTYPFQRQRFWLAPPAPAPGVGDGAAPLSAVAGHPFLTTAVALASGGGTVVTGQISLARHPWLGDHRLGGAAVLPAAALVELAGRAGREVGCEQVDELTLEAPLTLPAHGEVELQLELGAPDPSGRRSLTVHSRAAGADGDAWGRCASGALSPGSPAGAETLAEAWPPAGAVAGDPAEVYERLAERGYDYGEGFRGLAAVWHRGDEVFAEVALPAAAEASGFALHPVLLDAALHGLAAAAGDDDPLRVPFSWGGVSLRATSASRLRARLAPRSPGSDVVSLVMADPDGGVVASVDALVLRPFSPDRAEAGGPTPGLFRIGWEELPSADGEAPGRSWTVVGTPGPSLRTALEAGGRTVVVQDDVAGLDPADVVVLVDPADDRATSASVREALGRMLRWLQGVVVDERFAASRYVVVTRGAVAAGVGDEVHLAPSAVWGLVRSTQTEHPGRVTLVDIDGDAASWQALPAVLGSGEPQLALRRGALLAPRLAPALDADLLAVPDGDGAWCVRAEGKGTADDLAIVARPDAEAPLQPGEVRVALHAAGLNFSDVMTALGVVDAGDLGSEGAGVVVEVGPGVDGLAEGDRVMGFFSAAAFGPVAITSYRVLAPVPDGLSLTQAASIPMAFLTAYYALVDLADVQPGESVLVHAATGGVGMAAVQLARHLGAEVFGTASPGKWPTLRAQGLDDDHIASSRSAGFEEQFLDATGRRGVDVVLDCLTGELVDASLRLLPRGGRFVELGKTDIRSPDEVAARHPGVTYRAFDLPDAGPDRLRQMLTEVLGLFAAGALRPLPVTTWPVRRAPEAFRFMARARHVGKIVLTMPRAVEGTVLITGGTGALGVLIGQRMVSDHGVRDLLLVSRRGREAPGIEELVAELTAAGARVQVAACDVADREALAAVIARIPETAPLAMVVHAAGVLDDGVVATLRPEQLDRVLGPKVDGALHLHSLTRDIDLAGFVLFSSAAAGLGSPGQGNYAAANAALDALAQRRRAQGLAATSLAWGHWERAGGMAAAGAGAERKRMARAGLGSLTDDEGWALFDTALRLDEPTLVAARLDLSVLHRRREAPAVETTAAAPVVGLGARLAASSASEREQVLADLVRTEVAAVLGHRGPEAIAPDQTFADLGLDSLTGLELRNGLAEATGLVLPASLIFDYSTPALLASYLATELGLPHDDTQITPAPTDADARIHQMDVADLVQLALEE